MVTLCSRLAKDNSQRIHNMHLVIWRFYDKSRIGVPYFFKEFNYDTYVKHN